MTVGGGLLAVGIGIALAGWWLGSGLTDIARAIIRRPPP
jgi:hypothetical protein